MNASLQAKLQTALRAHQTGQRDAAEAGYRAILKVDPRHVDALYLLGVLLHQSGRPADAIDPLTRAIGRASHRAEFYNTLGDVYRVMGRWDDAVAELNRALALRAEFPDAQYNLARALHASGRTNEALVLLFNAVAAQPTNAPLRHLLAAMLQGVALHSGNDVVRHVLRLLLTDEHIAAQSLSGAVLGLIKAELDVAALLAVADAGIDPYVECASATAALIAHPLLLTALPRLIICDPDMERILTSLRSWTVQRVVWHDGSPTLDNAISPEFVASLAAQCSNSEYAWYCNETDVSAAHTLRQAVELALENTQLEPHQLELPMSLYALFAPLHSLDGWQRLLEQPRDGWNDVMLPIVRSQLFDVAEERQRAAAMMSITPINDALSNDVREMYESNPYPRWIAVQQPTATTVAALVQSLRPELLQTPKSNDVLVAGCGTGQQPIQLALSLTDATILAFDLSLASLAYGARMAQQLGIARIQFAQGDLLEFEQSERRYTIISCSGVLHHLRDPMQGWRQLLSHLAADGVMKIGLYSRAARSAVYAAREVLAAARRDSPVDVSADALREARRVLLALPMDHPAREVVAFTDFYSLSGVRDLVLHVHERDYDIAELKDCLTVLNLRFLGFQLPQPVQAQFQQQFGAHRLLDLDAWAEFEATNPATFAAMYQFWCCANLRAI